MASPAEDMSDSRSSVAGRKRALQTSSQHDPGVITIDSSADESDSQPSKRIKKSEDHDAEIAVDAVESSSSSPKDQPAHHVDPEQSNVSPLPAQGNIGLPGVWNQGVQSGLRTSFGKKSTKRQTEPLSNSKILVEQQSKGPSAVNSSDADALVDASMVQGTIKLHEDEVMANKPSLENNDLDEVSPDTLKTIEEPRLQLPEEEKRPSEDAVMKPAEEKASRRAEKTAKREKKRNSKSSMASQTEAATAYMDVHGLPIPEENPIAKAILSKQTYYPVTTRGPGRYAFGDNGIELPELTGPNGRPIALQDLNFRAFILFLLAENPDLKNTLTDKRAKVAFNEYVRHFYGHVPEYRAFQTTRNISKFPPLADIIKSPEFGTSLVRAADYYKFGSQSVVAENASPGDNSAPQVDTKPEVQVISDDSGSEEKADYKEESHENDASEKPGLIDAASIEDPDSLQKYFPAANGAFIPKCLVCGSSAHQASQCPENTCSSCGTKGDHLTPACPQTMVCSKCRQPGHPTSDCPEKLRATQNVSCVICHSPNHIEVKCHYIWRSFLPQAHEIKTVQDIQIHCYCCGGSGHFGPDCGLHQGIPLSGGLSWSRENLQKYLDPSSAARAISAGKDYSIPSRPNKGFSIKGRANDPIDLDASDDDPEGDDYHPSFIRPKINTAPKHGQIQFSQTAPPPSFRFQGNNGGNNNPRPPLPPPPPNSRGGGGGGRGRKPKRGGGGAPNRGEPPGRGTARGRAGRGRGAPPPHRRRG
ncbi:zinc knuckle domain-containing protein [Rutstroemia sp. NJR-2017a BVV2]|nr:zinc knuckle domain-containing protein [Rutstroemia sp. NJR-2017a BVV2]